MEKQRGAFAIVWLVLLCFAITGCISSTREFVLYADTFDPQFQQAEQVLDLVAKGERELFRRREARGRIDPGFDPNLAAYYVDTVAPPVTASIRRSLKSLKLYNDALIALANGEATEALSQRAGALAANVTGAVSATAAAAGSPSALVGSDVLIAGSARMLADAAPILKQGATWAARDAFRHQLVEAYPSMRKLLVTVRDGTPAMYSVLERYRSERSPDTASGLTPASEAALKQDREMLAGWVLMIDKTLEAMDVAVAAAANPTPGAALEDLSNTAVELRVLAEKVKSLRSR